MPANIIFDSFVSETTLFASRDAANSFFNAITVPNAETASFGVVKQATLVEYSDPSIPASTYVTLNVMQEDGTIVPVQVPSKDSFDQIKTAFNALAAKMISLLTEMKTAGQMQNV
jgi:hypothetical protein